MPWPFSKKAENNEVAPADAIVEKTNRPYDEYNDEDGDEYYEEDEEYIEETASERESRIRTENMWQCFGIFLFFVYLFCFSSSIVLEQSVSSSRLAEHLRFRLDSGPIQLKTIVDSDDFYNYVERSLLPALFENNTDQRLARDLSTAFYPMDISNRVLGSIRLRQVKVQRAEACQVGPMFKQFTISCYPPISPNTESTAAYGPGGKFTWSADPDGSSLTGTLASYSGNGYTQLLSQNNTEAKMTLKSLREDEFIGPATRALFIDFAVWSQNTGTYAAVTQLVEFGASGGTHHETSVLIFNERNLRVGGQGYALDWLSFVLIVLVVILTLWYMFEEFFELLDNKLEYFKDGWNVLDWINMFLFIAQFIMRVMVWMDAPGAKLGEAALTNKDEFQNLRRIGNTCDVTRLIGALNSVLLWLKCVKYLRKVPVVKVMIRNIWDALYLFIPFMFLFCLAYIGFSMAFNIGFGDKIKELSTIRSTVVYLGRSYLRDVRLLPAYSIAPLFGAVVILLFYVVMVLVGVTVVNAIFLDSIIRCKYQKTEKSDEEEGEDRADEPVEQFLREVAAVKSAITDFVVDRVILAAFPWLYTTVKGKKKAQEEDFDDMLLEALGDGDEGDDDEYDDDDDEDQPNLIKREDLLRAIEHMSGRVLSEISIVGIEIRSELHDVCERVAQMQMATEELTWRADRVHLEQDELIQLT